MCLLICVELPRTVFLLALSPAQQTSTAALLSLGNYSFLSNGAGVPTKTVGGRFAIYRQQGGSAHFLAAGQDSNPNAGVYRVGDGVTAPKPLYAPDPEYSEKARRAKYQGTVVLWLVVDANGLPQRIKVQRSLGLGTRQE
jgi:hypothetical protein